MPRQEVVGVFDDDGFLVAVKMNDRAETQLGLRLSIPCPDGPLSVPGGTTAEVTLATVTIPGGLMGPKGTCRVWVLATANNTANAKTLRVKFANQTIMTGSLANFTSFDTVARIKNRAANVQVYATVPSITAAAGAAVTSNIDTQQDVVLTITGQLATAGETLTLESVSVEVDPGF